MDQLNGSESSEALMLHGVPQGSILGPLFFILFINDLPLYTSAQLDLYADNTTVTAFADVKNLATLSTSLNQGSKLRLTGRQCDQKIEHWRLTFQNWSPAGDSRFAR